MRKSLVISVIILILLATWMISGVFFPGEDIYKARDETSFLEEVDTNITVEVEKSIAQEIIETRSIQGSLEPLKTIKIRSEIEGIIEAINFQKGQYVNEGDLLFQIDQRDLPQKLAAAKATLEFQEANLKASKALLEEGFETPIEYARKESDYKIALSNYENILKDLKHTRVKAPSSGIINSKLVEIGDFVEKNVHLADIVELEKLKVFVFAPQQIISNLKLGSITHVILENEEVAKGKIIFISSVADPDTRTYDIEIEIDNPEGTFQAGRSVTVELPLKQVDAHFISPALLVVSDKGGLGVKYIDETNIVREAHVTIARATDDGVWVTGLPKTINLIVQGAGFVTNGQQLKPKNISFKKVQEVQ